MEISLSTRDSMQKDVSVAKMNLEHRARGGDRGLTGGAIIEDAQVYPLWSVFVFIM